MAFKSMGQSIYGYVPNTSVSGIESKGKKSAYSHYFSKTRMGKIYFKIGRSQPPE